MLTPSQNEFVKETETKVYRLLEETPPNGKSFAQTVRHMLKREELWNNWKNEGCKGKYSKVELSSSNCEKRKNTFNSFILQSSNDQSHQQMTKQKYLRKSNVEIWVTLFMTQLSKTNSIWATVS